MKKNGLYLCVFVLITFSNENAFCQSKKEEKVPEVVRKSFQEKYPDTYVYEWEWEKKEQLYEAEFIIKGSKYESYFTKDGTWVKSEKEIEKNAVPQAVKDALTKTAYTSWELDDVVEQSTPQHSIIYELEMKANKKKVYLYFLPNGDLVDTIKK